MSRPFRIGVSACLGGEAVRWDGDHQRHDFVAGVWAEAAQWIPFCPELEMGLGVPREPIQLVRTAHGFDLFGVESKIDLTQRMNLYCRDKLRALAELDCDAFLLKSRSPSCGLDGARVFETHDDLLAEDGPWTRAGRGLFAAALVEAFPDRVVCNEAVLATRSARIGFVMAMVFLRELRRRVNGEISPEELRDFERQRTELANEFSAATGPLDLSRVSPEEAALLALV